jgi:hypothetical protein
VVEVGKGDCFASRRVSRDAVAPGEEVGTTVVLSVPEDAESGEYTVGLAADSDTHRVSLASETVEVLPETTPGPTTAPPPADGGDSPTGAPGTRTTAGTAGRPPGQGTVPGLGVGVAVVVLSPSAVLRRRDWRR